MKQRNLDGVYFRVKRDEKWSNICFTDLTVSEKMDVLRDKDREWLLRMIDILIDCEVAMVSAIMEAYQHQNDSELLGTISQLKDMKDECKTYQNVEYLQFYVLRIAENIREIGDFVDMTGAQ